ncbi:uncharacterized protein LOC128886268 [Hylaeus anthracinus]|uniref:uncharacterized protein LOC128873523 n=1 Tax=Hylaeus volcanicus TaxID=313075 RepID=UPI0023B78A0A|nr:uncharacterized protein LOC128873523 [Hylaeus volcanicus]XP_053996953.1 uncharacterized protein LOC128886268 [Hylaeus anthracinus]
MRAPWLVLILAKILDLEQLVLGDAECHRNDTVLTIPARRSTGNLSRRRRLTFPKDSAFVMTMSTLQSIQLQLPSSWYLDFEFDTIWPIQTQEYYKRKHFIKKPWIIKRRHRRELYANFETAFDSQNLPGRQCVLRTICEARTLLSPPGVSFVEDAIRVILRNVENVAETDHYDTAYRTKEPCDVAYSCPFSLLQILLFNLYSDTLS